MELLELTSGLERIELVTKITHLDNVTMREQQIALIVIGEWAREINERIREELKKPLEGALLRRGGLQ